MDEQQEIKTCSLCKNDYLIEEFYPRTDRPKSTHSWCKFCSRERRNAHRTSRAAERRKQYDAGEITPMVEKWCKLCDDVLPADMFYRRWDTNSLLSHYCKSCHVADDTRRKQIMRKKRRIEHDLGVLLGTTRHVEDWYEGIDE